MEQIYNILVEIRNNITIYKAIPVAISSLALAVSSITLYSVFKGKKANEINLSKLETKSAGGVY